MAVPVANVANVVCSPAELDDAQAVSLLVNLKPPAPQRYPLSEAQAASQCLVDGGVLGKLVLEP